jgi:hypothetical protein
MNSPPVSGGERNVRARNLRRVPSGHGQTPSNDCESLSKRLASVRKGTLRTGFANRFAGARRGGSQALRIGRVRQVGPPDPFLQISSPEKTATCAPACSRRLRVTGLPSSMRQRRGPRARTFHALELLVRHFDEAESARQQKLPERDRQQGRVDQRQVAIDRAEDRHQVETSAGPRQWGRCATTTSIPSPRIPRSFRMPSSLVR